MNVDDDTEGLEGLGVCVQSQEKLETEIIEQISDQLKKKEQEDVIKQIKKELLPLSERIKDTARRKSKCEKQIKSVFNSSPVLSNQQNRQIASLINDQELLENCLRELFSNQAILRKR